MKVPTNSAILNVQSIGTGFMSTLDPFLFCVYHKDQYPPGNDKMEAPRIGNGNDFNPLASYRMYHGTTIPGFPQHPHRGFETITATINGIIDHSDSVGNAGRYGMGDVQWMTAGKGIVHGEMFPLIHTNKDNPTRFFQIWLNLPSKDKMVDPGFAMFWSNEIPKYNTNDHKVSVTIWNGSGYFNVHDNNNKPPPNSWASDPNNDVAIWHITIQPGGKLIVPKATIGNNVNRSLYYIEGPSHVMSIDGTIINEKVIVQVHGNTSIEIQLDSNSTMNGEFLLLQGRPIKEPMKQYGPFVMNTDHEIQQAFHDYKVTQFGGWPWPNDAMVFPRTKGRFALLNGIETTPSNSNDVDNSNAVCNK